MGFEPTISTLTGWRALRAAPRGLSFDFDRISDLPMAQEGFEPSASLVLSESGLPVAYRADARVGSNPWDSDHKPAARPLRTWRSAELDSNPQPACADCFQTGPDPAGCFRRREFRGLESNQRPPRSERGVTTSSNCPGVVMRRFGKKDSNLHRLIQSQGACRLADSRVSVPAGVEPACRAWEARAWPLGPGRYVDWIDS